jgi:DedD protein
MEQGLKERLTGAAVIVMLAVIFIPMLLDDTEEDDPLITETNIPGKPQDMPVAPEGNLPVPSQADNETVNDEFSSRITPLQTQETAAVKPAEETAKSKAAEKKPVSESMTDGTVAETPPVIPAEEPAAPAKPAGTAMTADISETPTGVGLSAWVVQLGNFSSTENAESLNQKLRNAGYRSFVEPLKQKNTVTYRVRVGPEIKRSDADAIRDQLSKNLQLDGIVVRYP